MFCYGVLYEKDAGLHFGPGVSLSLVPALVSCYYRLLQSHVQIDCVTFITEYNTALTIFLLRTYFIYVYHPPTQARSAIRILSFHLSPSLSISLSTPHDLLSQISVPFFLGRLFPRFPAALISPIFFLTTCSLFLLSTPWYGDLFDPISLVFPTTSVTSKISRMYVFVTISIHNSHITHPPWPSLVSAATSVSYFLFTNILITK